MDASDLLKYVPEKYRRSNILLDLLSILANRLTFCHDKTESLTELLDPYSVPADYLQHLADLVGATLSSEDEVSQSRRRNELIEMIDWYKMKGTYRSLDVIGLIVDLSIVVYDKYTNNYSDFVDVEWFAGDEGENPAGLDSSYYKSPHFGMSIELDRIYDAGTYDEGYLARHLWRSSLFSNIDELVEKTRPVNTVPHYSILHTCITDESKTAVTISLTETITRIVGNWTYTGVFFDGWPLGSGQQIYFDEGDLFDTGFGSLISSITKWKLGTASGSQGMDLVSGSPPFALGNPVLSGTVSGYTIHSDRVEFEFVVKKSTVQSSISELGLYTSSGELMIASTFPNINKGNNAELKVIVKVNRTL